MRSLSSEVQLLKQTAWIVGQVSVLTIWLLTFLLVSCDGLMSAEPIPLVKHSSSGGQRRQCANKQLLKVALVIFVPLALVFLLVSCDGFILS